MTDELWTVEQAAAHLGIQPGSARGLLSRRKIKRASVDESDAGRLRALYRADEIRALAASRRPGARTDLNPG
ncbi:hypothetical protein [Streptomyces sp. NRRL F-5630]|uniref:hypothetical protein n=1 Tax=Streptomyces sp. NRRL F-5630 TaxID=1463864 RepID=UPI003EC08F50